MQDLACSSVKDSLLNYLREMTDVSQVSGDCIVTLPINTFDDRWVDVVVSEPTPNFFLVHDAGKASDELFMQGVALSESRLGILESIASRYGVNIDNGKFIVGCKRDLLQHSIWTIGQCSSLAMAELLRHKPSAEDEGIRSSVGKIITEWGTKRGLGVQSSVPAKGRTAQHTFDFVTHKGNLTLAVNVLVPTAGSLGKAQRYGYQALDLEGSPEGKWKKMAILSRPEVWSPEAKRIVGDFATVVDFPNPKDGVPITQSLDAITAAA